MTDTADPVQQCEETHRRAFRTYDRAVDVVSAFEALFTSAEDLSPTVRHFERFPSVSSSDRRGGPWHPDLSVLFHDRTALLGEIARVSRREESVDDVCQQLAAYESADMIPSSPTHHDSAERTDVMLLVPADIGPDAARRILRDRLSDDSHWYAPVRAPCIIQFMMDEGRYIFQRLSTEGNGIPDDGGRHAGLGRWFSQSDSIKVSPTYFAAIKAENAFMNDSPDPIYLATLLWVKVLPDLQSSPPMRASIITVSPETLAEAIRERYGRVRATDVRRALSLLETARLARFDADSGTWDIGWQAVRRRNATDIASVLASRACKPPSSHIVDRILENDGEMGESGVALTLFDDSVDDDRPHT